MKDGEAPVPRERRMGTARRIVPFFAPCKAEVRVVLGAILLTCSLGVINPILLKLLIDVAIKNLDFGLLNLFVILMIVIRIVSSLIGVGQSYLNNMVGQSVMRDLRGALHRHPQSMPLRFFTETRTGEIQSRLTNDVGGPPPIDDLAGRSDPRLRSRPDRGARHTCRAAGPRRPIRQALSRAVQVAAGSRPERFWRRQDTLTQDGHRARPLEPGSAVKRRSRRTDERRPGPATNTSRSAPAGA